MIEETIKRINELARKSKAEGLTPEELQEQQILRREYIERKQLCFYKMQCLR